MVYKNKNRNKKLSDKDVFLRSMNMKKFSERIEDLFSTMMITTMTTSSTNCPCPNICDFNFTEFFNKNIQYMAPGNVNVTVVGPKVTVTWTAPNLSFDRAFNPTSDKKKNEETFKTLKCLVKYIKPTYYEFQYSNQKYDAYNEGEYTNEISEYYDSSTYSINNYLDEEPVKILKKELTTLKVSKNPYFLRVAHAVQFMGPYVRIVNPKYISFPYSGLYDLGFNAKLYVNNTDITNIDVITIKGVMNNQFNASRIEFSSTLLTKIKEKLKISSTETINNLINSISIIQNNNKISYTNDATATPQSDIININSSNGNLDNWAYVNIETNYAYGIYSSNDFRYILIENFELLEKKYS
jgi:hypothetical protein